MKLFSGTRKFCISKKATAIYCAFALLLFCVLQSAGLKTESVYLLGLAFCGYVVADMLLDIRKNPPKSKGRVVFAVFVLTAVFIAALLLISAYIFL
ncbi:MAG: hypothetical protein LUC89_05620 [Oscillospiraceae bacterium]|nr:hypothetical protein [Oscillospiraceae bacterium]